MSALSDYRLLWRAAFTQRQASRTLPWTFAVAGVLSFLGSAAAFLHEGKLLALRIGLAVSLVVLQFLWTMQLIPGFAMMNTPANACLVPRMRRRMVEMTVFSWLVAGLASLLLPMWQIAPAVGLYMVSLSLGSGGKQIGFSFAVMVAVSSTFLKRLPPEVTEFFLSFPGFLCASLCVALYGAWCIRVTLPAGGDRHFSARKESVERIERLKSIGRKQPDAAPKRVTTLYAFALHQAIRSGRPRRLMLHALGPGATVTLLLPGWVFAILLGVAGYFLLHWLGQGRRDGSLPVLAWIGYLTVMLTMQVGTVASWRALMTTGKGEQGLLRLAARSPSAGRWNRELGRALVGRVALNMAFGVAAAIALVTWTGLDHDGAIFAISLASALFMPGIAFVLLDYSREQHPWSLPRTLFALSFVAIVVLFHVMLQFRIGASSWLILTAYSNVIGAFIAAHRWKEMQSAPVAFPTGRFA